MNKIYIYLILAGIVILSVSQIYLWKDQQQQWQIMDTQMKILNRLLQSNNDAPFVYEDELPENYPPKQSQDI